MIRVSTKGPLRNPADAQPGPAYHDGGTEAVILKDISEEEEISIRYLEQIIIPLKINKLVKSIRGAGGGYTLARKSFEITICEILHALEGSCGLVECVEDETVCERMPNCATYEVWKEATMLLKNYFESITLEDLVKIADTKQQTPKAKAAKNKAQ